MVIILLFINNQFIAKLLNVAHQKAYIDMTGGIQEGIFDLKNYDERKLWTVLTKAKSKGSLMGCSINVNS